jgi:mono/diheme cytochrome c family protein
MKMNLRRWAGAIALVALLLIATTAFAQGDQIAQGAKLFAANCAVCHGDQGEGRVGARLQDFPSINPKAFVKTTVASGVPGSKMPAWSNAKGGPLTDAEIDAIAAFVATWTTGDLTPAPTEPPPVITPLPTVAGVTGDPTRGAQVFQQNCAVCHGAKGEGRVGANIAKPFASASPAALIKQVVSEGVKDSVMPAWAKANGGPLSDQQIDDVTAFVISMQKTSSPTFTEPTPAPVPAVNGGLTAIIVLVALVALIAVVVALSARGAGRKA